MRPSLTATFLGALVLTLGLGTARAIDSDAIRAALLKLAGAIEKKDAAEAKKQADVLKAASLLDLMDHFKLRTSEGLGVGPKPGAIKPDGIEDKVLELADPKLLYDQKRLDAEAAHLVPMAYAVAAVAESARGKCTVKVKDGDKDPQKWQQFAEELRKSAVELGEAARAKDLKETRAAAARVKASCNSCHGIFR